MSDEDERPTAKGMAESLMEEFRGDTRPATAEMVAGVYSTMFAQQEALVRMFAVVMKANPSLIFTDEVTDLRRELTQNAETLAARLKELANRDDAAGDED